MRKSLAFSRRVLRMGAESVIASLVPACDVEGDGPAYRASSSWPWLSVEPFLALRPGRWFRLRYRLGLYDRPVRPLISYRRGSEEIGWALLPGPVLGCGEGVGIAPGDTTAVWISPAAEPGPFNFALEKIEILSLAEVLRLGLRGNRARLLSALATFALGWRAEAELNFRWAALHAPLANWPCYKEKLLVAPDPGEFERPRCDWAQAPIVRLLARLDDAAPACHIGGTIAALKAQIFPHWTLSIVGGGPRLKELAVGDPRIGFLEGGLPEGADRDMLGFISLGDRLMPHALACFVEALHRAPQALVAYCDEETGSDPVLKPDWSPRLEAARPYVGRLMLTRLFHARRRLPVGGDACDEGSVVDGILRDLGRRDVLHIPRILIETQPRRGHVRPRPSRPHRPKGGSPQVTIVIPTRDRHEMLRRSIASLLERTAYPALDLVIVDNGSKDPQALAVLAAALLDPRVRRVEAPGAFNFSHLCNLGAAGAQGDIVIFLNNDVEIIRHDWIDELVALASDPDVGAVGCMLLYPQGRIQHAGIVVGMGDGAGHCDAGSNMSAPGWLERNTIAHEVSAVTGACLAVERSKFWAVGGFDAIHLPVELNDIDLCLRLEELGYQTIWTPFARAIHLESASRGKATFRRLCVHSAERRYFRHRWADRLRDDPFYHPGFSLFSLSPALA